METAGQRGVLTTPGPFRAGVQIHVLLICSRGWLGQGLCMQGPCGRASEERVGGESLGMSYVASARVASGWDSGGVWQGLWGAFGEGCTVRDWISVGGC